MIYILRLSVDINLVAFVTYLLLKPTVEFVLKKLVNAIEIICILRLSVVSNVVAFVTQL